MCLFSTVSGYFGWIWTFFFFIWARISFLCLNSRPYSLPKFWRCSQMRPWPCTILSVALYSTAALSGRDSMTCFPTPLWIAAGTSLQPVYLMRSTFKEIPRFVSVLLYFFSWLCYYTICYVCIALHSLTMPSRSGIKWKKIFSFCVPQRLFVYYGKTQRQYRYKCLPLMANTQVYLAFPP